MPPQSAHTHFNEFEWNPPLNHHLAEIRSTGQTLCNEWLLSFAEIWRFGDREQKNKARERETERALERD